MSKLIIIAAGTGSRLLPYTKKVPKPLLPINKEKTILELALEEVIKSKVINEVVYIVGHLAHQIEAKLGTIKGIKTRTVYNPFYKVSGNLYSLWFACNEMDNDDIVITNADNIIHSSVYKRLMKEDGITLAVCKRKNLLPDEMKAQIDGDEVVNVSKNINENTDGLVESVSLVKISKDKVKEFRNLLDEMVKEEKYQYEHWPSIFYRLFKAGVHVKPMLIPPSKWSEIDYHGDLMDVIRKYKG